MSEPASDTVREVELMHLRLPLVVPFRTAHNTTAVKDTVLVHVRTDAGSGWGECTAQVTPEYDGETLAGALHALRNDLVPRAFAGVSREDTYTHASARAALECALLDARLRSRDISLSAWLGGDRPFVDAGVAVGMSDDVGAVRALVRTYVDAGYRRIKCKIEPGHDVEVLAAVRDEVGPSVQLAADANGTYSLEGARRLFAAISDLGLQCVEQPCAAGAIADHVALVRETRIPVCLDETITSPEAATDAIARNACAAISVKVGRLGIDGARRTHDACVHAGVGALPGGMLETGIGRAALVAVAALPGFSLTGDVSASARYFGAGGDITEPFVLDRGRIAVPTGAGLGVEPLPDRLAECTIAIERLTPR